MRKKIPRARVVFENAVRPSQRVTPARCLGKWVWSSQGDADVGGHQHLDGV